jgi:elongator complex protein 3
MKRKTWFAAHEYTPEKLEVARCILDEIANGADVLKTVRHYPLKDGGYISKNILVEVYHQQVTQNERPEDPALLARIRMKPIRTLSGVATVTVLTAPNPCPGECIFCPNEENMPKSYLADEPGAARAVQNQFDPYLQVSSRMQTLQSVGHPTDKIELLILGGTWNAYPLAYREHFIGKCFEALNGVENIKDSLSAPLDTLFLSNEKAAHRDVGLAIETRPDEINPIEIVSLRRLGVTKVQMGAQSLDDNILSLNCRGHTAAETLRACAYLRAAGFKIVLHWMPNLYGATLESDHADFARIWHGLCPDELKIYPTQLLDNTTLHQYWEQGKYQPYTTEELISLIADLKVTVPPYCRINRIVRDIPSQHIVAGNKRSSLRQDVLAEIAHRGQACHCIRCREIRARAVDVSGLELKDMVYFPAASEEHFLSFVTPDDQIAGYLRLSLPRFDKFPDLYPLLPDLEEAAIVREVHVYGQALAVGAGQAGAAQHIGLGTILLQKAEQIARLRGCRRLAVISAVGTRGYYLGRGFERGDLYLIKNLIE